MARIRPISVDAKREIIDDFAELIDQKKTPGPKPSTAVIHFRNEKQDQVERPVVLVPIELLRYRKDNGRIASDVANYELLHGVLDEKDVDAQATLEAFLAAKDPEKTETLIRSMRHIGQNEPAIITADGFLINGNRRKMVLAKLKSQQPGRSEFAVARVVILPGKADPGGPPTLLEIERLENRYQLQSEGKSEYYGFDRAISMKRKIELGFSLEEQLRDDPRYANATKQELKAAINEAERDYLLPLECVDRYLHAFGRDKLYGSISKGPSDAEGRWQAFIDYSQTYNKQLRNQKWLMSNDVAEDDIGALEDAAFKIIRLRHLRGLQKVHVLMRQLGKMAAVKGSRNELLKLGEEVESRLSKEELRDADGEPLSPEASDRKWAARHQGTIINRVKKALTFHQLDQEKEAPISLLQAALQKLNHEQMLVENILLDDLARARKLASEIQVRAKQLEQQVFAFMKQRDGLQKQRGKRV